MLTWTVVIALALGVYIQRAAGAVLIDTNRVSPTLGRILNALPLAIITAVIALAAFSSDGRLVLDARAGGVAVAALCAWRRAPMFLTVVAAALTTALLRLLAG